jgi:hypothetical protein
LPVPKQHVDRPLAGDERRIQPEPGRGRAGLPDGPPGKHRQRVPVEPDDWVIDTPIAATDVGDGAAHAGWDEDPVSERSRLLHGPEEITGRNLLARRRGRLEVPTSLPVECGRGDSALDHRRPPGVAAGAGELGERALGAVEDRAEQAGAELRAQRLARVGHGLAGGQPRCVLVDLDHGVGTVEADHLPGQAGQPHVDDVVEARRRESSGNDHRSGHAVDLTHLGRRRVTLDRRPRHVESPSRSKVIW